MKHRNFSLENRALPMHYPGFVFRTLCDDGYPDSALLAGTDLTKANLTDPDFRCGLPSLQKFYRNAISLSGDPHIGLRLALRFEPTTAGLPLLAAMNAASLGDALRVFSRFAFLTYPVIEFTLLDRLHSNDPAECALCIRMRMPLGDISYFSAGSALLASDVLMRAIVRREQVSHRAQIAVEAPPDWHRIAEEMPFPIQFGAGENRLFFPAELLDTPLPGSDPLNHRHLVSLCERMAQQASYDNTLAHIVSQFLEGDGNLGVSLAETANALGVSQRSLRRQLEQTGTSFRKLVRDRRESHARKQLAQSNKPIQTIAFELGFDTASNFSRSFKQWTGVSPSAFRASQT
ncbi:MAG: AraC family transcriptional regulator ligand-binding domain-containing protein [Pseudomonadota bacterium]